MKILNYPPDPAVEEACLFVDTAFQVVNWNNFREEIRDLEFREMLSPTLARDIQTFLHGTLRRLFWEIKLCPVEYLEARRVLEAVCDVIDVITADFGPGGLEEILRQVYI
jgi:hypothetical protein